MINGSNQQQGLKFGGHKMSCRVEQQGGQRSLSFIFSFPFCFGLIVLVPIFRLSDSFKLDFGYERKFEF